MQHVGATVYIHIYTVCMCISMCGATMHTCVVALSGQYGILTSTVHTVHVMYIVLSHSNKYNIIVEQYIIEYNIGNESIRNFLPGD